MKTCPICEQSCFDFAKMCYECDYQFEEDELEIEPAALHLPEIKEVDMPLTGKHVRQDTDYDGIEIIRETDCVKLRIPLTITK